MKSRWVAWFGIAFLAGLSFLPAQTRHRVIFDTDFVIPPQDDGLALLFALSSPELDILGITTVAGNMSRERATSDALRVLEIVGRGDIPVYNGANMPLVHEKSEFATRVHGEWWSDAPPPPPPGGFARIPAQPGTATDFIIRTVLDNPGQISILALGPLTNIAMAIRQEPGFARAVKDLYIMGGAIAFLPDGAGNVTPNAEFNFWVDPEAARVVLRSGIPIMLSPLNASRKTRFTKEWYDRIVSADTPGTRLLKETMGPTYQRNPDRVALMFDQLTVASLIDPAIVKTRELYVDVDVHAGLNYGVSVGWTRIWPGAEGAQKMQVQYDVDWNRFIKLYVERLRTPALPKK